MSFLTQATTAMIYLTSNLVVAGAIFPSTRSMDINYAVFMFLHDFFAISCTKSICVCVIEKLGTNRVILLSNHIRRV